MGFTIGRFLLLCGACYMVSQSGVHGKSNVIPTDYSNMTCHLANGKEGICVYAYLCQDDVVNTDGSAIIDLRFSDDCEDYFLKCCSKESPCNGNEGTCLPRDQCGADLTAPKYKQFKESEECDWSGYQCCPNKKTQQDDSTNTDRQTKSDETEAECDDGSLCVPEGQCMVNTDGVNVMEARMGGCGGSNTCCPRSQIKRSDSAEEDCDNGFICVPESQCMVSTDGVNVMEARMAGCGGSNTCCPQDQVKKNDSNACEEVGGTCVQEGQCKSVYNVDERSERCDKPGLECCMELLNTTEQTTENTEPTATEQPDDVTCESMGGTCKAEHSCQQKASGSVVDCDEDTVCCLAKNSEEIPKEPEQIIKDCGYRNEEGIEFATVNRIDGESQYGEFPWMVAVMVDEAGRHKFACGGTLIDPEVVITTAECVKLFKRTPQKLIIRAGEWDMGATMEPIPHQERRVSKIKSHVDFKSNTLVNNIALLFLDDRFELTSTINTVCLPPQDFSIDNGELIATGWGTTPQNRTKYQQILKSIDLPYMQRSDCERALRRATTNKRFKLHSSFLCAGGEAGKDTCQGDAGSPVVHLIPDDSEFRFYAVGMVSWGVGCGRAGTPSVYTDIAKFRNWIDKHVEEEGLQMNFYEYQPENANNDE